MAWKLKLLNDFRRETIKTTGNSAGSLEGQQKSYRKQNIFRKFQIVKNWILVLFTFCFSFEIKKD